MMTNQWVDSSPALRNGVSALSLTSFRNYKSLHLKIQSSLVVLTGSNGAGKTNVLEALSFLIPGRGLRRVRLQEVTHLPSSSMPWAVSAHVSAHATQTQIGTGLDPESFSQQQYRRIVNIDGTTHKNQSILSEYVQALWLTPQMDRLFIDGSSERRAFLDRLVFNMDPSHATRLNRYEHAARERMRLLKAGQLHPNWLEALETQIAAESVAIETARLRMIEALKVQLMKQVNSPFPGASIDLKSHFLDWIVQEPALIVEEKIKKSLQLARLDDAQTGRMRTGIQYSDLLTVFTDKAMPAAYCSTGEQKALLISLVLAAARYLSQYAVGVPLLLLDEVVAHLDEDRRLSLFKELEQLNIQTWMTGTDTATFRALRSAMHLNVHHGTVSF